MFYLVLIKRYKIFNVLGKNVFEKIKLKKVSFY